MGPALFTLTISTCSACNTVLGYAGADCPECGGVSIAKCTACGAPAHATETDDDGRCEACRACADCAGTGWADADGFSPRWGHRTRLEPCRCEAGRDRRAEAEEYRADMLEAARERDGNY